MTIRREISADGHKLIDAIRNLKDKSVRVGWFEKSRYDDEHQIPVAQIAAQNEFGNPKQHIPARPFMRPAIAENQQAWIKTANNGVKKVIKDELTINQVLELIGQQAVGDIKKSIKKVYQPALAETTVLNRINRNKKLSNIKGKISEKNLGNITKPLIDTGIMFNTVTHEIVDG